MPNAAIIMPIAFGAFLATMAGGLFALSLRDRLHLVLGFSAGAVIAVAFFDLLPEAMETGGAWGPRAILSLSALGFFVYTLVDRLVLLHSHDGDPEGDAARGWIGAGSFSAHSVLDGFAIGVAFQAGYAVGVTVAIAVLVHDFSDGLNTVNVVITSGGKRKMALRWLMLDAVAPVIGAGISLFFIFPRNILSLALALFAGFFLYIGASDLLPESHHAHPRLFTTIATLLGAATLFAAIRIMG
ncbi:MAG TPA: ZIP family metal transporter [Rhizomicrobium sp.]|nr:ZIP family metal transporter [Rhizomicrobium sp.]